MKSFLNWDLTKLSHVTELSDTPWKNHQTYKYSSKAGGAVRVRLNGSEACSVFTEQWSNQLLKKVAETGTDVKLTPQHCGPDCPFAISFKTLLKKSPRSEADRHKWARIAMCLPMPCTHTKDIKLSGEISDCVGNGSESHAVSYSSLNPILKCILFLWRGTKIYQKTSSGFSVVPTLSSSLNHNTSIVFTFINIVLFSMMDYRTGKGK